MKTESGVLNSNSENYVEKAAESTTAADAEPPVMIQTGPSDDAAVTTSETDEISQV